MRMRRPAAAAGILAIVAITTACFGSELTRAGVAAPTVLRLGIPDAVGNMPDEIAAAFVDTAEADGTLEIELWRQPDDNPRWNQEMAQRVIDGEVDLAIIPAPAWDALDVSTFSAMFLPFAVTSDVLLNEIAQGDIAADMLAGLEPLGLTGLALVPGGFRHLFSARADSPVDPLAMSGETVRVAYSKTVWGFYEHIGAVPIDPNGHTSTVMELEGEIDTFDSMFRGADHYPTTSADLVRYAHAYTIVAGSALLERLSDAQRESLRVAGTAAVDWSVSMRPHDPEAAAALCDRAPGAHVGTAGPEAVAAMQEMVRPFVAETRADPVVDRFAGRIAQLDARLGSPAPDLPACDGGGLPKAGEAPPNVPEVFPDGEYRREVTEEALIAAGVDVATAQEHVGTWVLILEDGIYVDPECASSTYDVVDDRLVVRFGTGEGCGSAQQSVFFSAGWQLRGDELTFTAVESGHGSDVLIREAIGGGPWTKVR